MLHVKFPLKLTCEKLILFDSDFTIMTAYMKLRRVWNFNSQNSNLTEYLSLNHQILRDLNHQEEH